MDLNQILITNPVPDDIMNNAYHFDSLCRAVTRITEQENTVFFNEETITEFSLSARKAALLEDFESQASVLFEQLRTKAPLNVALQRYFICRLEDLQNVLRINTSLQLHTMSRLHSEISGEHIGGEACH